MGLVWVVCGLAMVGAAPPFDHEHQVFNRLLRGHVTQGRVAYSALRNSPEEADLDAYLKSLHAVPKAQYATFSPAEKLAFWINGYNAHALKAVVRQWPTASLNGKDWLSARAIPLRQETGADVSLDEIEDVILPRFKEPRAFLALAPGPRGLPLLRSSAYRADALDSQLDDAAGKAVRTGALVKVDPSARAVAMGEPFRRHRSDFESRASHLAWFVAPYLELEAYEALRQGPPPKVTFLPVDYAPSGS